MNSVSRRRFSLTVWSATLEIGRFGVNGTRSVFGMDSPSIASAVFLRAIFLPLAEIPVPAPFLRTPPRAFGSGERNASPHRLIDVMDCVEKKAAIFGRD